MEALSRYPAFYQAMESYFAQDYLRAYPLLLSFAEQGDAIAQCALGMMYHMGLGVPIDFVKAVFWYELAAEQGDAIAAANLDSFSEIARQNLCPLNGRFEGRLQIFSRD